MSDTKNVGVFVKVALKAISLATLTMLVGWLLVPQLIQLHISNKIAISPEINPKLYAAWIQPPIPVYLKVYLFNVTNSEEVEMGMVPKFQEIGPYIFQETRTKVDVSFDNTDDTATYKEQIVYHFHRGENGSRQSLNDVVTLINVPFVAAAIKVQRDVPWPLNHLAHMVLLNYKEPLFVKKTVQEALFEGWKVPFLEKIESEFGLTLIENNTFAFFMGLNATDKGPYTIQRGVHGDKQLLGKIIKFKNESKLDFWGDRDNYCNTIQGTDGTIFPPNLGKNTILRLFNAEVCVSIYLTYNDSVQLKGIPSYRFTPPISLIEDPRKSEQNRCYCPRINSNPEKCLERGALDLSSCRDGAPVATSNPHFLDADPKYLSMIAQGLKPDRRKHEASIDVEPLTGIVVRASKKIQLNLILEKVPSIPSLRNVNPMLFPLMWADEGAELDQEHADHLSSILYRIHLILFVSRWGSLVIFTIAIILIFKPLNISSKQVIKYMHPSDAEK